MLATNGINEYYSMKILAVDAGLCEWVCEGAV